MADTKELDDTVSRCLREDDPLAKREVPLLALALLGASVSETSKITDQLLDHYKGEAERQRARAERAEQDLQDVEELHAMLCRPSAARALMRVIRREQWFARSEEADEEEGHGG